MGGPHTKPTEPPWLGTMTAVQLWKWSDAGTLQDKDDHKGLQMRIHLTDKTLLSETSASKMGGA